MSSKNIQEFLVNARFRKGNFSFCIGKRIERRNKMK